MFLSGHTETVRQEWQLEKCVIVKSEVLGMFASERSSFHPCFCEWMCIYCSVTALAMGNQLTYEFTMRFLVTKQVIYVFVLCVFFLTERRFKKTVFAGGRGLPLCQKWVPTPTPEFWTLLCAECQSGRYGSCMCFSDVETNLINVPNLKFHPKGKQTWKHQIKQENSLHWSGCCWVLVHFKWSEDTVYKDH